jgi:hypothetical protein
MSTINATTLRATTIQHTNGTNAMLIDTVGRVAKPNHPCFYVQRGFGAMSAFVSGVTTAIATWNQFPLNRGNHFTSANGRFTAPVAGVYLFTFHISYNTTATNNADYLFCRNGAGISETVVTKNSGVSLWGNAALIMHINLEVNDFVTVGTLSYEGNTGSVRASFGGCLIG